MKSTLQFPSEQATSENKSFFKNLIWLNTKEASEYLRVTPNNLRVMVYRGVVKAYKLNNRNRFHREELDQLIMGLRKRS